MESDKVFANPVITKEVARIIFIDFIFCSYLSDNVSDNPSTTQMEIHGFIHELLIYGRLLHMIDAQEMSQLNSSLTAVNENSHILS